MRKLTTQTQNSNPGHRYSQHYPRLITGNYIPNDPANANDPIALRRQRIAQDYEPHDISEESDADY
jgi:hypothetical protein